MHVLGMLQGIYWTLSHCCHVVIFTLEFTFCIPVETIFFILFLYAAMSTVLVVQQELVGKDTLLHLFQIMTDLF
jgi:hypothetical protein